MGVERLSQRGMSRGFVRMGERGEAVVEARQNRVSQQEIGLSGLPCVAVLGTEGVQGHEGKPFCPHGREDATR